VRGFRRRDHRRKPGLFDPHDLVGRDRLDLRHNESGPFLLDQCAQRRGIRHVDHMRAVRDLLRRRIRVAIDRNGLDAQPLQLDDNFLAELTGAQQHHLDRTRRKRRSEAHSGPNPQFVPGRASLDSDQGRQPCPYRR
jgi:hypothetical protein